ncbi:hypothetical protein OIC43_19265 [Streptomyces sp. NBC_00825]|nr:hypothetical protein OG832_24430 [Streptomyces sp. NBC_00826]WTH91047.1 hypothetical protein OIC43_19265 [Streptomyces sp. NBC_00825]WTH99773.1 hypothetical protein OHA23_19250 [Streptomyces sp. NBC_00822]
MWLHLPKLSGDEVEARVEYRMQLDFAQRVGLAPEESRSFVHHIARDL